MVPSSLASLIDHSLLKPTLTVDELEYGVHLPRRLNVSLVLSGRWNAVSEEVDSLTKLVHDRGQKLKLIFETCYLTREQKLTLCEIASAAQVDWVKTST